jgi:hypothetical protein
MVTPPNKLAREIATVLDDLDALPLHQSFTRKYSETFLRKILMRVLSIPERKIKRSRAALFNYLIQLHEHSTKQRPTHSKNMDHYLDDPYEEDYNDGWD